MRSNAVTAALGAATCSACLGGSLVLVLTFRWFDEIRDGGLLNRY
jgi:hypothetical protein